MKKRISGIIVAMMLLFMLTPNIPIYASENQAVTITGPNAEILWYEYTWEDDFSAVYVDYDYVINGEITHILSSGYHTKELVNKYAKSEITEPTCFEQGYTTYTLNLGYYYVDDLKTWKIDLGTVVKEWDYVPALGHDYVEGICTRCGDVDVNYVPDDSIDGPIDDPIDEALNKDGTEGENGPGNSGIAGGAEDGGVPKNNRTSGNSVDKSVTDTDGKQEMGKDQSTVLEPNVKETPSEKNHNFKVDYDILADYSSCTATYCCSHCSISGSVTAALSSKSEVAPSATADGAIIFNYDFSGLNVPDGVILTSQTATIIIPAVGNVYTADEDDSARDNGSAVEDISSRDYSSAVENVSVRSKDSTVESQQMAITKKTVANMAKPKPVQEKPKSNVEKTMKTVEGSKTREQSQQAVENLENENEAFVDTEDLFVEEALEIVQESDSSIEESSPEPVFKVYVYNGKVDSPSHNRRSKAVDEKFQYSQENVVNVYNGKIEGPQRTKIPETKSKFALLKEKMARVKARI